MRTMTKARRFGVTTSLAALTAVGLIGSVAGPAQASSPEVGMTRSSALSVAVATYYCDDTGTYSGAWVPIRRSPLTVDCILNQGAISRGVRQLQTSLNKCYSAGLVVDSNFGPATKAALISVQKKVGAVPDGVYGPQTRKLMRHEPTSGSTCVRVP